jgi:KipI family sensor histidine kinase inhibitor
MTAVSRDSVVRAVVSACGPAAVGVRGASGDAERDWRAVHHIARFLTDAAPVGLLDCIPTYDSLLVEFDAALTDLDLMVAHVHDAMVVVDADAPVNARPRHFEVPVAYGGEFGPDLDDVARIVGVTTDEIVRLHLAPRYVVRCLGAPGGSPMLDGPAFPVAVPRLSSPRAHVPAGKVSVAGRQATITPAAAPGGWRLIGATPVTLFDLTRETPVPYRPGDTVAFRRIDADEFDLLDGAALQPQSETER